MIVFRRVKMFEKVRNIIAEELGIDNLDSINLETSLTEDLDADSIAAIDVIMALEDEFGIEIPDEEAENFKTIKDICKFIEDNK
jgi:acyl carrier protein